jgi:hypothetical protein
MPDFMSEHWRVAVGVAVMLLVCDFCATFYVRPKPEGAYGRDHRNVPLTPKGGMLILDVVGEKIAGVEVLYRPDVRSVIQRI